MTPCIEHTKKGDSKGYGQKRISDAGQKFVICNAIRKMVTDTRDSTAGTQTSDDPREIPGDAVFPKDWHKAGWN